MRIVLCSIGVIGRVGSGSRVYADRQIGDSFFRFIPLQGRIGTAPAGPRTVPVRSAWPGTKALTFCSPPQRADMLRTGTVRGPGAVSRCSLRNRAHNRRLHRMLNPSLPVLLAVAGLAARAAVEPLGPSSRRTGL